MRASVHTFVPKDALPGYNPFTHGRCHECGKLNERKGPTTMCSRCNKELAPFPFTGEQEFTDQLA